MFAALGYVPTPRQQEFHDATEYAVLYGGAAGGGKTRALLMEGLRACMRWPGIRVGAFRRSYPELKESLLAELAQTGYARALDASWNGSNYELTFPNGSLLMFRYAQSERDVTRRQGGQYQLLLFDERTLTPPQVCRFLEGRLRTGRADIPVLGVRSGTNPGGIGHTDVKDTYITPTDYGQKVVRDVRGRLLRFIPSKLADNPHVNPEYATDLLILDEEMRAAFLEGNWDMFHGMAFKQWNRERHIVEPFTPPASWLKVNGIDWGYAAPWCVLWLAQDEDGRVWVYRELYGKEIGEVDQAHRILAAEMPGESVGPRFADDAMWATRGDAKPIATVYGENSVHLTPAGKGGRVTGWQRVRSYLGEAPACPHHRALGWATCPRLHVFSTCTNLTRTLPTLPFAITGDPEDVDTAAEDHCLVAGTPVLTRRGDIAIEQVVVGDEVMTRGGWRRVLASALTGRDQPVLAVEVAGEYRFTATGGHPVWTENRGWVRADALRYTDTLLVWHRDVNLAAQQAPPSRSSSTASPSAATPTQTDGPIGSTTSPAPPIAPAASDASTRKSGRPRTAPSPTATTSTTATRTPSTTTRTTSSASPARNTTPNTPRLAASFLPNWLSTAPTPWSGPRSGTAATPAGNGIASTRPARASATSRPSSDGATSATSSTTADSRPAAAGSARTAAELPTAERPASTTRTAPARPAATRSGSTGTAGPGPVPASAVRLSAAGTADVYNLTVEHDPEFFAGGVLVHNCADALRYGLLNLGGGSDFYLPGTDTAERVQTASLSYGAPVRTEEVSPWG